MRERITGFAVFAILASQCVACANNISVYKVLESRGDLVGKVVHVNGVIEEQGSVIKICQEMLNDDCINLEYTIDHRDTLKGSIGKRITLEGIYKEHEYVESEIGLNFIPSRISVLRFLPNNNKK